MYKIYSRKRIKIPNIHFDKSGKEIKSVKKIFKIILVLFIAFSVVNLVLKSINPIFETICEDEAKSIATLISNEQATVVMKQYSYDELFTIEKDDQGNITMIKSNIFPINAITSDIAIKIQQELNKKGRDDVEIAAR